LSKKTLKNESGLAHEEQSEIMQQWFCELWEDAVEQGLDPEIIARVVIEGAVRELVHNSGEKAASRLVTRMKELEEHGAFLSEVTLQ